MHRSWTTNRPTCPTFLREVTQEAVEDDMPKEFQDDLLAIDAEWRALPPHVHEMLNFDHYLSQRREHMRSSRQNRRPKDRSTFPMTGRNLYKEFNRHADPVQGDISTHLRNDLSTSSSQEEVIKDVFPIESRAYEGDITGTPDCMIVTNSKSNKLVQLKIRP